MLTNNIVVQFACSLNEDGTFKEYRAVSGSVFNEEYSETLDSATIVLSQIPLKDRLVNIKPYQYVRVYDKSGNTNYDKLFLIDNYNEKENNIEEHLFGYTINLMSETKWLEKIQCPNLSITHDVINGVSKKKTIYQYITQYMDLFVPKIKFCDGKENVWNYKPLLTYPTSTDSDFYKKFNISCADMSFSAPTLRQLITNLMLQVGCIPVVKNRVLGYLDFQKDTVDFGNRDYTIKHTVNSIIRSLSSDSYVNNFISVSENVLDSNNEVICETLGFRDRNNVFLKQLENLSLETSLPIYKINKCLMHGAGRAETGYISSNFHCSTADFTIDDDNRLVSKENYPIIIYKETNIENGKATIKFSLPKDVNNIDVKIKTIKFWGYNPVKKIYQLVDERENIEFVLNTNTTQNDTISYQDELGRVQSLNVRSYTLVISGISEYANSCVLSGTFDDHQDEYYYKKPFIFIRFANNDSKVEYTDGFLETEVWFKVEGGWTTDRTYNCFMARYNLNKTAMFSTFDITKLVVENSVRQNLNTNFLEMIIEFKNYSKRTIDNLSKYIYGTVGYSIGSKKIEGFSSTFNYGGKTELGWVDLNKSYIENIMRFLTYKDSTSTTTEELKEPAYKESMEQIFEGISGFLYENTSSYSASELISFEKFNFIDFEFLFYNVTTRKFEDEDCYFTSLLFDLYYQPLNSFNLAYSKSIEDIDIPICQYNSNASGVTDFDRLSLAQQEQIDRIGNETLTISQRTNNVSYVQDFEKGPLLFKDDTNRSGIVDENDEGTEYIIFKRSMAIGNNCFNVTYNGSKGAILKNYFTSIRTKYRAYQYIDYSSSVLRKERDTLYVRISKDFYNADDRIWLGNYSNKDISKLKYWIYNFKNTLNDKGNFTYPISYECEYDVAKISNTSNDSTTELEAVKNSVSLITTNNMVGIIYEYVDNIGAGTYLRNLGIGSAQTAVSLDMLGGLIQSWQIWEESYSKAHTVSFVSNISFYQGTFISNDIDYVLSEAQLSPIVTNFINLSTSNNVIFNVVDDNSKPTGDYTNVQRTFYKDNAERINHSIQFIYYTDDVDILFDEDFMSGTYMIGRFNNEFNVLYSAKDFEINKYSHEEKEEDIKISTIIINENSTIKLDKSNLTSTGEDSGTYYGVYSLDIQVIMSLKNINIDYDNVSYSGGAILKTTYSVVDNTLIYKVWCPNITMIQESLTISIPYSYIELDSDFYTDYIDIYQEDNGIPYIKVTWHDYSIIKMSSLKTDGTVIDIAAFKRPEDNPESTNYYFTINDTKTDYVLSEKNGIIYRRYKVGTTTDPTKNPLELSRDVIKLYKEEDS